MVNVHRIHRKVNVIFVPSTSLILTFDMPSVPDRIRCGFFNLRVRQYVPNSLHCFKCQRFGLTQEHCMAQAICVSCGQKAHSLSCQSSPHCINCNGPHGSNSRECQKFQMERKFRILGSQIRCHSRRLGVVTRPSTQSIFHGVLFQASSPPIVHPPLLRLRDLCAVVFIARLL